MKYKRQEQIIKIIKENKIRTHEQLIEYLAKAGVRVTQATVSRDIKELGLIKIPDSKGSFYGESSDTKKEYVNPLGESVKSICRAMHTVVVKTYPGMAPAVAASIDELMKNDIVGSIAGDDTVLVIAADEQAAQDAAAKAAKLFR